MAAASRDESVQFSLKELLKLEDQRLEEQSRERRAHEALSKQKKEDEERRRRDDTVARERAELEAFAAHQKKELDDLARREAMQKAIVEQSRLEVEVRARTEERDRERRHEIELQRLRHDGTRGNIGPLAGAALLGGAVMMLVACGIHFGSLKPATDRRIAELEQNSAATETRSAEISHRADDQKRAIDSLERKLADAQNEIATLKTANSTATRPQDSGPRIPKRVPSIPTAHVDPPPAAPCLKGDPLCPSIEHH